MAKKPAHKAPATYEEHLAAEHRSYERMKADYRPTVNYFYKVGEEVVYGNLKDARVEEVLEEGSVLHVSFHDTGLTYGLPYDNGRKPRIVSWNQVTPSCLMQDTSFSRERIRTQDSQTTLDSLIHIAYRRGLISSPEYQRDYVWTLQDRQNLVGSIFNRTDIGKFLFLEREHPEHRLEVIDGKQRLNALMEFVEGRFEFKGKTYFNLSFKDRHAFTDIMIHMSTIQESYTKKSDILYLFLSLNAGGVPQTEEHIAKVRKMYEAQLKQEAL